MIIISTIIKCQISVSTLPLPLLPIGTLFCVLCSFVSDSETSWTVACQAPLSTEFSRQEYWSGLPFPPPGDLPDPGIKSTSLVSPALAGGFFTTSTIGEASPIGIDYFTYKVEIATQIQRRYIWTSRGKEGGMNWEIGTDRHTLLILCVR